MQTKKEFIAEQKAKYKLMKRANKLALELENTISQIRAEGFKLIVLGDKVKITF